MHSLPGHRMQAVFREQIMNIYVGLREVNVLGDQLDTYSCFHFDAESNIVKAAPRTLPG